MRAGEAIRAAMLDAFTNDSGVQSVFGAPARIYNERPAGAGYPNATIATVRASPADVSGVDAEDFRIDVETLSKMDGVKEAQACVAKLIDAVQAAPPTPVGWDLVLFHPVYADVFRTKDTRMFRGVIRFRAVLDRPDA